MRCAWRVWAVWAERAGISQGTLRQGSMAQVMRQGAPVQGAAAADGTVVHGNGELVCVGRARVETLNLQDTPVTELRDEGTECGLKLELVGHQAHTVTTYSRYPPIRA
jgi:hypothetical protein